MEGNNMTQIRSIRLGLIAICIATVPLSLAQTPRTGTSGSNKTAATIGTAAGHSGLAATSPAPLKLGRISGVVRVPGRTRMPEHTSG